ncbi:hypothetical protein EVAR_88431_1 [Eumeta japonica]|uniref:Uncharacterized protein n=1 Tax=Eumeta variegata TaxID=151549 RepID=A0A4C1Y1Z4_EUMVA|nr:hypothetical protein EVAR_88431_1 [Eumeta japonica]
MELVYVPTTFFSYVPVVRGHAWCRARSLDRFQDGSRLSYAPSASPSEPFPALRAESDYRRRGRRDLRAPPRASIPVVSLHPVGLFEPESILVSEFTSYGAPPRARIYSVESIPVSEFTYCGAHPRASINLFLSKSATGDTDELTVFKAWFIFSPCKVAGKLPCVTSEPTTVIEINARRGRSREKHMFGPFRKNSIYKITRQLVREHRADDARRRADTEDEKTSAAAPPALGAARGGLTKIFCMYVKYVAVGSLFQTRYKCTPLVTLPFVTGPYIISRTSEGSSITNVVVHRMDL